MPSSPHSLCVLNIKKNGNGYGCAVCLPFAIELLFFVGDFTFGLFYLAKRSMKVCSCVGPTTSVFPHIAEAAKRETGCTATKIVKRISLRIHFAKKPAMKRRQRKI